MITNIYKVFIKYQQLLESFGMHACSVLSDSLCKQNFIDVQEIKVILKMNFNQNDGRDIDGKPNVFSTNYC